MFINMLDEIKKQLSQNHTKCTFKKKTFSYLKWPSHNVLSPKCMFLTYKFFSYKTFQNFKHFINILIHLAT